jgi:hypothetical protein
VDPVPHVGDRLLDGHAADLDSLAGDAQAGEVVEDGAAGTADLERLLRTEHGHDLGHGLLVGRTREVPDPLVLVIAVAQDHLLDPVEVGRLPRLEGQEIGPAPERRPRHEGVRPEGPDIGHLVVAHVSSGRGLRLAANTAALRQTYHPPGLDLAGIPPTGARNARQGGGRIGARTG